MWQGTPCNKSIFSKHIFESQRWALEAPKLSSKAMLLLVTRPSKTSSRKTLSERHIIVDNSNCVFRSTGREESAQLCVYVGEEKVEKHSIICMAYQHIPTRHIPTRWEYDMMIRGGNVTLSHSHHIYYHYHLNHHFVKVVDLWGSKSSSYTADTLTTVFSRCGNTFKS